MRIEFYKINEVYTHKYYKIPKDLFDNSRYKTILNSDAKLLYALLLDRMELSRENGWVNGLGEIYLIYTRDDLCNILGLCRNTMTKAFKQLSDTGLIFEKRQGRGLPNLIFIGKIQKDELLAKEHTRCSTQNYPHNPQYLQRQNNSLAPDSQNLRIKKCKNYDSRIPKNEPQDSQDLSTRETDIIKTDKNNTDISHSVVLENTSKYKDRRTDLLSHSYSTGNNEAIELQSILEKCELHIFTDKNVRLMLQHALEIMYFSEYVKVGTARIPQCMVRSRMYSLHGAILSYALDKVKTKTENTAEIRNSTSYLISTIYNAITEYYSDAELDPELNRYLNADRIQSKNNFREGDG